MHSYLAIIEDISQGILALSVIKQSTLEQVWMIEAQNAGQTKLAQMQDYQNCESFPFFYKMMTD